MNELWPFTTPGVPDELFLQDRVPMTKEEVRALLIAKARLAPGQEVYDVGAGTGTVSVEAARLVYPGTVWAVEKKDEACELVRANARRFGLANISVVRGEAPEALEGLPPPDRVIVGGGYKRIGEILSCCAARLKPQGIVVVSAVTWETVTAAVGFYDACPGWETDVVCLNVAKLTPRNRMRLWRALNPIYLVQARKGG